jgi:hypothetical protein
LHILIDGDPIVYSRALAGEERSYEVIYLDSDGEMQSRIFSDGNEKNKWIKAEQIDVVDQDMQVVPKPVSHALAPIKRSLLAIISEASKKFDIPEREISVQLYLTGPGNFREELATQRVYKGNRDRNLRPFHYEAAREYMIDKWGARLVEGYEADDAISIDAHDLWEAEVPHVIATIDKDLDQIPGPHFDYNKKVWYHMDEEDAIFFFYQQILQGDATDNIQGVYRLGKKKAHDMMHEWAKNWRERDHGTYENYLWDKVVDQYEQSIEKNPDKYVGDDAEAIAIENARLVYMQTYVGQLWTPPGEMDETL